MLRLARPAGLDELAQSRLSVPTDKGANAGGKVMALVAGMLAGADSIDDMNVLRHGGMGRLFDRTYAPSTLGSFLREFRFGHLRQLDAVASRTLVNLTPAVPLLLAANRERVVVDLDDTIIEVHGYKKAGRLVRVLRRPRTERPPRHCQHRDLGTGGPGSAAAAGQDRLPERRRTDRRRRPRHPPPHEPRQQRPTIATADSAFYGHGTVGTAIKAGADVSVTVRMDPAVKTAIATIPDDAWETIEYPNAIRDEATGRWISKAEVAEVPFVAFRSRKIAERVEGRLVVRRIPDLNPKQVEQPTLFDTYRHHAFFTTTDKQAMGTVAADKTHRAHAIIEQVHTDLKGGPLAHLPSGVFTTNSAWLVLAVIAFNLTRAAGLIADQAGRLARATTATIRRPLIAVPARLARSARRIILHLPEPGPGRPPSTDSSPRCTHHHRQQPADRRRHQRHDREGSGRPG